MFLDRVLINCEAQTGCVGDGDVSILDDRLGHTVNEIAPEWDFDEVMLNPAKFGIENTADKCAGRAIFDEDTTPCSKPAAYYFYHAGHPSTAVHKAVGEKLYQEVLNP